VIDRPWQHGAVGWVLDLDGVMWLGAEPIPGSAEAVARLSAVGEEYVFVTNNSSVRVAEVEARLEAMGAPASGRVVSSATTAARLVAPGERVLVLGGAGAVEELTLRGARVTSAIDESPLDERQPVFDHRDFDVVVVGLSRSLTYEALARACLAVRAGARLVATNDDTTYPTPRGLLPGGGALLAAVVTATGATPQVAGKPHPTMVDLLSDRVGPGAVVVGDRDDTDGALARAMTARFALVLSGVTGPRDVPTDPAPDVVAADLSALVAASVS
jgi:HAD superfamily hydrolase (TIGR01450 family)